ncbi:MAG: hypothetical protein J6T86_09700 [Bacteroidales bacterium]|nr:hypothetical protein [Bacteroidales bacterium]
MRKIVMITALCLATCTLWAQNEVSLVVSGEGKDKEEATFKALRSAVEQAYGTFVSANTTVLNDQLVADEIVSLSSGNIQKYEYVSENKMPNGNTLVTLSATVSIDKLVSFAESKGMEAELKGGLFAMNIKKMEFDKKAEEKAVDNLCKQLETMLPTLFDYEIKVTEPKVSVIPKKGYDGGGYAYDPNKVSDYEVDFEVFVSPTENLLSFYSILANTLYEIGLSESEYTKYKFINMPVFSLGYGFQFGYIETAIEHYVNNYVSSNEHSNKHHFLSDFQKKNADDVVYVKKNLYKTFDNHTYNINEFSAEELRELKQSVVHVSRLNIRGMFQYTEESLKKIFFRSEKSIDVINDLIDSSLFELYNFVISDDLRDFELFVTPINVQDRSLGINLPNWLVEDQYSSYIHFTSFELDRGNYVGYCLDAEMTRGEKERTNHFLLLLDIPNNHHSPNYDFSRQFDRKKQPYNDGRKYNDNFHPDEYKCLGIYGETTCTGLHLLKGKLFYEKEEISKITHISVSKPIADNNINTSTESAPQESNNSSLVDEEIVQIQSKLPLYNDTLQQAVNEYNTLLKQYPYNYKKNRIAYTLSSELPNDEFFLKDTLHTLLNIISEKTAQLVERYKKDSLEFKQMSQSLQDKINEANAQLLNYPYNLQKLTLKDSLSFTLFGKTEELTNELRTKIANLPKMQEQIEREVYEKLMEEDPQRFTEIYFTQNPSKKQEADKSYIECRCKYKERLVFDMAFIHNTLTDCDCREKEYQIVSEFFHSREDFDQMFNQEESAYNMELNNLKSMMADKKAIEEILFNSKQLNFKKSMLTSNEDLKSVVNRINEHKGKYYYADVIDAVFKLNDKLAKEWEKNGIYFKSKAEMFEYWISEEYDKVLKARKKE